MMIKKWKNFNENIKPINELDTSREGMIELISITSNFEKSELRTKTDEEIEELYRTLEVDDWIDELDREEDFFHKGIRKFRDF